jgi:hypothetical protein
MEDVEPLLVNRVNTWRLRPEAGTRIENFCLASDYVRTSTDLATMEGANEAARRAVNAILERSGSKAEPCQIWDLHEPDELAPMRAYDKARYDAGLPWDDRLTVAVQAALKMAQDGAGTRQGGEGLLTPIGPVAAELSKPDGPLNDPILSEALRMIGPPKGTVPEIARLIPGLTEPLPGAQEATEAASGLVATGATHGAADLPGLHEATPAKSSTRLRVTQIG